MTSERFTIGHLRGANVRFDLELALHPIDEDVEVKLAHALDDRLARFMVGRHAEAGILGGQAVERDAHLFLVGLGLRLDAELDDRIGELHPLEDDRGVLGAQRVARGRLLEAGQSDDVAGIGFLDVLTRIRVHQEHTADLLVLVLDRVQV